MMTSSSGGSGESLEERLTDIFSSLAVSPTQSEALSSLFDWVGGVGRSCCWSSVSVWDPIWISSDSLRSDDFVATRADVRLVTTFFWLPDSLSSPSVRDDLFWDPIGKGDLDAAERVRPPLVGGILDDVEVAAGDFVWLRVMRRVLTSGVISGSGSFLVPGSSFWQRNMIKTVSAWTHSTPLFKHFLFIRSKA